MPNVEIILRDRVEFQVESIDRMLLNLYMPRLQRPEDVRRFLCCHREQSIASPALLGQMTKRFVEQVAAFAEAEGIPVVPFKRGERKEEVAREHIARFSGEEGVVFIGLAQERANAFRSHKRPPSGVPHFEFYRASVCVNHYYFYLWDRDFGPAFLKICSYFPFTGRVWLNGHEWAKRQLDHLGIRYEALDNGFRSVEDPDAS